MTESQRKEWEVLKDFERNSLMWPDFLEWEEIPRHVKINRQTSSDDSIGLVSVNVQDFDGKWYNVAKRVKENHPAHGHVEPYEWITKVDGKATTNCSSEEFRKLITNGKTVVTLSLKKAVDSLSKFVKEWGEERMVTLNLKEGNNFGEKCRFVHFYCKKENGKVEDRILVWERKPGANEEISEPLCRGDELLEVNNETVKGKKLADIYQLFCKVSGAVQLKIKKIHDVHDICNEMSPDSCAAQIDNPDEERLQRKINAKQENSVQHNDELRENSRGGQESEAVKTTSVLAPSNSPPKSEGMKTQSNTVKPDDGEKSDSVDSKSPTRMNKNAGCANVSSSFQNESFDEGAGDEIHPSESQTTTSFGVITGIEKPTQETKKTRRQSSFRGRRRSSQRGSLDSHEKESTINVENQANEGYKASPEPIRKNMCSSCSSKGETQKPVDRNKWPIRMIETSYYWQICKLLDLEDSSKTSILAALDCFSLTDAQSIKQQFREKGGRGMTDKALGKWGATKQENNVGALKEIVKKKMERVDVLEEIEKWEKIPVCYGCGVKL